jgi:ABC-type transport system involved in multi-copper enzyme maturation permease subunit
MVMQSTQATASAILSARGASGRARLYPLFTVLSWELRRVQASRATWGIAALILGVCFLSLRVSSQSLDWFLECCPQRPDVDLLASWTTLWGLASVLRGPALLFALFVPFVATEGVVRDLKRRTHEILMATPLPTWAYVSGRYLANILLCVGLAMLLLLAICVTAVAQHVLQPSIHPSLELPGTVAIWAVIVLPPAVVLGSFSFALGTLLPQCSNLIKLGVLLAWFATGVMLPQYMQYLIQLQAPRNKFALPWYAAYIQWDPTSSATELVLKGQFFHLLGPTLRDSTLSNRDFFQHVLPVVQQMPDLSFFVGAHLAWIGIGIAAGVAAAILFRRFRNAGE